VLGGFPQRCLFNGGAFRVGRTGVEQPVLGGLPGAG
jgi:hypothetical protein